VRRLIQVLALVLVVLSGSLPGLYLLGSTRVEACCAGVPAEPCPCPMPARSSGPIAPCGLAAATPVAQAAAPSRQAQTRPARIEPSPLPLICLAWSAARLPLADPSLLAHPGPTPPPGPCPDRHALLSVFRI